MTGKGRNISCAYRGFVALHVRLLGRWLGLRYGTTRNTTRKLTGIAHNCCFISSIRLSFFCFGCLVCRRSHLSTQLL